MKTQHQVEMENVKKLITGGYENARQNSLLLLLERC